jgi:membrane protease YdiL (CAAX protease family)
MAEGEVAPEVERSLVERILNFPLVTMLVALTVLMGIAGITRGILKVLLRDLAPDNLSLVTGLVVCVVMILTYKLIIRRLGEQPRDDLSGPRAARQLVGGLGIGLALFSVIVAVAAALKVYRIVGIGDADFLLIAVITNGLFPAVSEELLYRGIIFRWFEEFAGTWAALLISSVLFGAAHFQNPNASVLAAVGVALEGGLLLGGAYMLTRRLWLPMGIHASWNVTQGGVFDIPISGNDAHGLVEAELQGPAVLSGGGFGLEASLIAIVISTLFALHLIRRAVRAGQVVQPWWVRGGYRKL